MMKPKSKRPLAVWSTAHSPLLLFLYHLLQPMRHIATVTEVKGTVSTSAPVQTLQRREGIRRYLLYRKLPNNRQGRTCWSLLPEGL